MEYFLQRYKDYFCSRLSGTYDRAEAESIFFVLLEDGAGIDRVRFRLLEKLPPAAEAYLESALPKLKDDVPVQYITGCTRFYGRCFAVNEDVLIPRPETEELVETVLENLGTPGLRLLDVGTGSGCIAVTLALECPACRVDALDVSYEALHIADRNAVALGAKMDRLLCDILDKASRDRLGMYDVIVSNPPYVRLSECRMMRRNVLRHEPHSALFVSDGDPLVFYREILDFAGDHLNPGGRIFFEINQYLGMQTAMLAQSMGYGSVELIQDISGNDRILCVARE